MKGFVNEGICQLWDLLMEGFDNQMIHRSNISIWRSSLLIYIFLNQNKHILIDCNDE